MYHKIVFVVFASLLLSGCTLLPSREDAATDAKIPSPTPVSSPISESDYNYESTQSVGTGSDIESLEKDLNMTSIPDEDLSDILGE